MSVLKTKTEYEGLEALRSMVTGFLPGAFGGICCVFVGHPIDLVKVQMQTMQAFATNGAATRPVPIGTFSSLTNIFVNEGIQGLYRGVTAPLAAITPSFAITFWSHELAQSYFLSNQNHPLTTYQHFLAGGFTGIPMTLTIAPSERIKCLLQTSRGKYDGMMDCAKRVYAEGGIKSIFRGSWATMMRDVPGNAAYFGTYGYLKSNFDGVAKSSENHPFMPTFVTLFAGGMAGVANWIVAIPMDVVKNRYQAAEEGAYKGIWDVAKCLIRTEGFGGFYRGLGPALIRAFPANAATFAGVEAMRNLLTKQ